LDSKYVNEYGFHFDELRKLCILMLQHGMDVNPKFLWGPT
jgi:hypothetical protein